VTCFAAHSLLHSGHYVHSSFIFQTIFKNELNVWVCIVVSQAECLPKLATLVKLARKERVTFCSSHGNKYKKWEKITRNEQSLEYRVDKNAANYVAAF
jgi:hypothetical protein